jgi:PAS domain S-box-containing protein
MDDEDKLLRSVALQNANSIRIARQRAEQRTEAALREQASLLNLTHDSIFVRGMDDVITYWNRGAEELYGWPADTAVGQVSHQLTQTIFPAPLAEINAELLRTGRWEGELQHTKRDGTRIMVASRWSLHRDERQRPHAILETNNDITDRKQAEMLLAGEKRLLEMIARGDSCALILDAMCRLFEELASDSLSSILLLDNANRLRHGAAPRLPIDYIEAIDGTAIGPSVGSCGTAAYRGAPVIVYDIATDPLWADFRDLALAHQLRACWSTPILSSEGRVLGTFATYYREPRSPTPREHNVIEQIAHLASIAVERERAEAQLRQSEEQWRNAFENNPTMYFMVDAAGTVLSVNPFGAEQLGYNVDELVGQPVLSVSYESDRDAAQSNVGLCLERLGRSMSWELRKMRKDGSVLWVRETARAVPRVNGPIVLIACEDITEQRRAEEALRQVQAELAHVSRVTTMGELTASLAHEVNQPLSAVVANGNACLRWLLADPPNLARAREAAERIVRDGKDTAEIVRRVRALFKRTAGEKVPLDLNEVIGEVLRLLRSDAARRHIIVETELEMSLPPVVGDRIQLQQVLLNLVLNGLEAMDPVVDRAKRLVIRSARESADAAVVEIRDHGVGMKDPEKVFAAFYTTKESGMGMGLAICRSIIDAHHGRLWVAPSDEPGARLCFTIPFQSSLEP